ncbi:MAG: hypothetical protein EBS31_07740 [Burkholderiaceae bacterium]|nr:hypothetical protein [Burkholderiaceae bacterium]
MTQVYVDKKPSVSSTTWTRIFHNGGVAVYEADKYYDFYKVSPVLGKPKYFFGETAWMDAQRFAVDNSDFSAYNIFK